ncbi:hypothetical protein [Billgrantia antri]|uniref:Sel1 repeat family protein n=1 Tax=Billgrantia antri TaxID=2846777 RepID=A0ABS6ZTW2_9GAMM|nr:hypothetical protein [Halomonas antri]MBW6393517.1 hypothetical protein [Halomonas antri]
MPRMLIIVLLVLPISAWALEPEVQAAKDEGMRVYGLGIAAESIPLLEPAAEAGDVDAMYYLGEIHRLRHMGLTRAAMAWYLKAAAKDDVYSMLQLFRGGACTAGDHCPEGYEDWHHAALAVAQPQAEAGDPDAMLLMFDIYRMFDQPRRAADWLAANQTSFRHEPDFQRAYHRGEHLVRLSLEDVEGKGTIEYWNPAERKHHQLEDQVSLLAQPATLTWRWNKQGGRR